MPLIQLRDRNLDPITRVAEGLPRRRFTVAELDAMAEAGILGEDERIELIGGEVVRMSPKGDHHETLRIALNEHWVKRLPAQFLLAPGTTFRLSADTYVEPDFLVFDKAAGIRGLKPETAHFAVEVADSSYAYDTGIKADIYAAFRIPELWVIHAVRLETRIHRAPSPQGYLDIENYGPDDELVPAFAPELAVRLSALELL